jgi:hypothetical protein
MLTVISETLKTEPYTTDELLEAFNVDNLMLIVG